MYTVHCIMFVFVSASLLNFQCCSYHSSQTISCIYAHENHSRGSQIMKYAFTMRMKSNSSSTRRTKQQYWYWFGILAVIKCNIKIHLYEWNIAPSNSRGTRILLVHTHSQKGTKEANQTGQKARVTAITLERLQWRWRRRHNCQILWILQVKKKEAAASTTAKKLRTPPSKVSAMYIGSEAHHWWKWSKPIINLLHRYRIEARECMLAVHFFLLVFSSLMFLCTVPSWS